MKTAHILAVVLAATGAMADSPYSGVDRATVPTNVPVGDLVGTYRAGGKRGPDTPACLRKQRANKAQRNVAAAKRVFGQDRQDGPSHPVDPVNPVKKTRRWPVVVQTQTVDFGIFWPPLDRTEAAKTKTRPLLKGRLSLEPEKLGLGWTAVFRIALTRPSDEAGRWFWNARLAFPEYDWMSQVRVWDTDRKWLWPNLPYLLRIRGKERVERYGGIDPGKGVDNDFAAVLVRDLGAGEQSGSADTRKTPLVSAEWHPVGAVQTDRRTLVHTATSDEFTIYLGGTGEEAGGGTAGIWLIYADFLGAKPPKTWPQDPEYAGGILAYFEVQWAFGRNGVPKVTVQQTKPIRGTGFDWKRWGNRARASDGSKASARLSDLPSNVTPPQ